jgi:hypothetical protein
MQTAKRFMPLGILVALSLTGCNLFSGGDVAPSVLPTLAPQPTNQVPATEPPQSGGTVSRGDVLFVRDGQIWVTSVSGGGERVLTSLPAGSTLRSLALSASGQYVAFTVASQLMVLDLATGQTATVVDAPSGGLGSLAWSMGSDVLIYQQITQDEEGILSANSLWRASMPPGTPPEQIFEAKREMDPTVYYPVFVPGPDQLVVHRVVANSDDLGSWLLLTPSSGATVPLVDGYGLWDISSDQTKVLMYSQTEAMSPTMALFLGMLPQPAGAVVDVTKVSPEGVLASFRTARFALDGVRIAALQVMATDQGEIGQAVLLQPDESGTYQVVALASEPGAKDMTVSWHGDDGVIVQRWLSGEDTPTLWLLPLDGSPGRMLAAGELPLVVGSH